MTWPYKAERFTAYGSAILLVLATLTVDDGGHSRRRAGSKGTLRTRLGDRFRSLGVPRIAEDRQQMVSAEARECSTPPDGTVTSADGTSAHKVVHTVTGLTKVIDGVNTLVMWDRDYSDGELAESELAFFAQSKDDDVWLFGEYPEEYENGKFVGAPSTFISGIAKAQAGIAMQGHPRTGTPAYVQAYAPKVDFLDCGDVIETNRHVCVPTGCYDDVLVIDEFNPLEPPDAGHQRKFYSAGTGLVRVTAVGGDAAGDHGPGQDPEAQRCAAQEGQRTGPGTGQPRLRGQHGCVCQDAPRRRGALPVHGH